MVNQLDSALSLTEQMISRAQAGEWEEVAALDRERRQILASFFSKPLSGDMKARVAEGIRTILEKDREILRLGVAKRSELKASLSSMGKKKSAVKAYSAVS